MRKGIVRLVILVAAILIPAIVFCQDTVKVSASFTNTEIGTGAFIENLQGVSFDADFKIKSFNNFRIGGVFNFQAPAYDGFKQVGVYSAGPQLSYRVGPVEPFVGAFFGLTTGYAKGTNAFTRTYRVGVDVPFTKESKFFIRPFFAQWQARGEFRQEVDRTFGAGAGVRF